MTDLNEIRLPVNNELGDQIVVAWLKLHMEWAQDSFDKATTREDKDDAELDLIAMRRVLKYAGGEGMTDCNISTRPIAHPCKLGAALRIFGSEGHD